MQSFQFSLSPPRHPLLRTALALAGLALLGFFAVFALVIAGLVLAAFGLRRVLKRMRGDGGAGAAPRTAEPGVLEGEFTVVSKAHPPLLPR